MDDGLFDALPDDAGSGLVFAGVVIVLGVLWWLVRRTRERHIDDLERRHQERNPPPEPEDPRDLPGS